MRSSGRHHPVGLELDFLSGSSTDAAATFRPASRRLSSQSRLDGARIAVVHEWLHQRAGSEQVFERVARLFPDADLFALTKAPTCHLEVEGRPIATSYLDRSSLRDRRHLSLPLMPGAWRRMSHATYDVVITSTHAFGRYFGPAREALHLSYCHAPMRYVWNPEVDRRGSPLVRTAARLTRPALRRLDRRSLAWTESLAVNSRETAARVAAFYGRDATVIHPAVNVDYFGGGGHAPKADHLLAVSRFVTYKRLDIAIDAAAMAGRPLVIAGSGPLEAELRRHAELVHPGGVRFSISPSDETLRELYARAAALVYPAFEDFGIVPVEAQAAGTPVVAFRRGGTADTVIEDRTGVLVDEQTAEAFAGAISTLLADPPTAAACRANADRFAAVEFDRRFLAWANHEVASRLDPCEERTPDVMPPNDGLPRWPAIASVPSGGSVVGAVHRKG